jgi:hypothetical protein
MASGVAAVLGFRHLTELELRCLLWVAYSLYSLLRYLALLDCFM